MRKFAINVNGKTYEVEVEEINEGGSSTSYVAPAPVAAPVAAPTPTSAPAKKDKPADTGKPGSVKINSPMPGSIFDMKVAVGDEVKKGDVVIILEAMKMENEIMAPQDGKIASLAVNKGDAVDTGDVLVTLE